MGRLAKNDKLPPEFTEYILLKHFKCTPSQLDNEDYHRLENYMLIERLVNEANELKEKSKPKPRNYG